MNIALASGLAVLRLALPADSPAPLLALLLVVANVTMATASLLPVGPSDGRRALSAFRRSRVSAVSPQLMAESWELRAQS
jgi:Zn-dependent protease